MTYEQDPTIRYVLFPDGKEYPIKGDRSPYILELLFKESPQSDTNWWGIGDLVDAIAAQDPSFFQHGSLAKKRQDRMKQMLFAVDEQSREFHYVVCTIMKDGKSYYTVLQQNEAEKLHDEGEIFFLKKQERSRRHRALQQATAIVLDGVEINLKKEQHFTLFALVKQSPKGIVSYEQIADAVFPELYVQAKVSNATQEDNARLFQGIYDYLIDILDVISKSGFAIMCIGKKRNLERKIIIIKEELAKRIEESTQVEPEDKPIRLGKSRYS